jgi:predicted Rossmann fold nucleotide-binding protein DprA/Smf involved in DNA uptake
MTLTDDSQAILLLCSHLGLPTAPVPAPFTLRDWNPLARKLATSPFKSPGALLDADRDSLRSGLEVPNELTDRIHGLLQRRGVLAVELERLESLGIWTVTRGDDQYPARWKRRLGESAPIFLFGAGEAANIEQSGVAVVGSRNIDDAGRDCAEAVGAACAASRLVVFSGGARGTDAIAMLASLEAGGRAVGVLADSLEKTIRAPDVRAALADGRLTLLTPYSPKAGFSVGAAMGRNKLIYASADYALIVASEAETGGTWAGATEALRAGWIPVFVRDAPDAPDGNRRLLKKGGISFPMPAPSASLDGWLAEHSTSAQQPGLFA